MRVGTVALPSGVIACAAVVAACSSGATDGMDGPIGVASSALGSHAQHGKVLFDDALSGTNGRSCATCHVPDKHFILHPADVAARLQSDPEDPLFNTLDADDPTAATPTYEHLEAGLVRVTLTLADNLDVVDSCGNVVTNCARTIDVWRGVPTVENTAYTAPYQYDGRFATLPIQADAALHAHSQIDHEPTATQLADISDFETTVFSGTAAAHIAAAIKDGDPPPDGIEHFTPGSQKARGEALFTSACAPCHGTPTQVTIVSDPVHDRLRPVLNTDGSVTLTTNAQGVTVAAQVHTNPAKDMQVNLGIAFGTYVEQADPPPGGPPEGFFPQYRMRFYTDATRTQTVFDLPPLPPAIGPTLAPQAWSVDPGLAATTGDPDDWEAFDVPQLRGIKYTAPYFHDNSALTLMDVLDTYSRFIFPVIPELGLPPVVPLGGPGLPPYESLTLGQKLDIIAFLETL
jgi:cytochrome c peroxidase